MNPGYLLLWIVLISTLSLFARSLRTNPKENLGWLLVSGFVTLTTALASLIDLDLAGWVGAALWLPLIVIPGVISRSMNRAVLRNDFKSAIRLAHFARLSHPWDGFWQLPRVLTAQSLLEQGKLAEAESVVSSFKNTKSTPARLTQMNLLSFQGKWKELVHWFEQTGILKSPEHYPQFLPVLLRALGETGRTDQMVQTYQRVAPLIHKFGTTTRASSLLVVFAFTGRLGQVQSLLQGPLHMYVPSTKDFWSATAGMTAGQTEASLTLFRIIANSSSDQRIRLAAERRIREPLPPLEAIPAGLTEIEKELNHEREFARPLRANSGRAYATYVLIALNVIMFILENLMGGSTNGATLYRLGALVPEAVLAGEYWRLLAANFLHFGSLHLIMNLFALNLVGSFIEAYLGMVRYLLAYLTCGIFSMVTVTELHRRGILEDQLLVGASGCITGLIGLSTAVFLKLWYVNRTPLAWERVRAIGVALLIQVAFDLSTQQVSFTAHTAGTLCGFAIGLFLRVK